MARMTPKEYLRQLKILSIKIQQKESELEGLRAAARSVTANIEESGVHTPPRDKTSGAVAAIVDLENDIKKDIAMFLEKKDIIIDEIQSLNNPVYVNILFKRYVEYKSLAEISVEMSYSYNRIRHLHGAALNAMRKKYPEKLKK